MAKAIRKTVRKMAEPDTRLAGAPAAPFPAELSPMLASLSKKPFDEAGWMYEVKWDGYRALAFVKDGNVTLRSRNNKPFDDQFYPIHQRLKEWKIDTVVDGEIVVVNEKGLPVFGRLQQWRSEADGVLLFYVFDILWLAGRDLTSLPLTERKELLRQYLPADDLVRISDSFTSSGLAAFETAQKMGLEGIIAKKEDSSYQPGARTTQWLKIKTSRRQEAVIGGYTVNEGSPKPFSSLLLGVYENGKLQYTGKVGTGFNRKMQEQMMDQFSRLESKRCPFTQVPDVNKPSRFRPDPPIAKAVWLQPKMVAEISYAEMTTDGVMRHPSFLGLRTDKNPKEVVLEQAVEETGQEQEYRKLRSRKLIKPTGKKKRKTLLNPSEETQVREIDGRQLKFTNLSKVFWPEEQVTKRDMLNYYYQVAPFIVPYLLDRPLTLNRHPNGIYGKSFYQKDVKGKVPDWIETFPYHSAADNRDKEFMICTDEASLMYVASLGCIEMNPWSSRIQKPDNPDWCIIDLDPDGNPFSQVIQAAQVTKGLLDELKVEAWCKTSGSTGLHIYIPFGAKYTYEDSKELGRKLMRIVNRRLPKFTSIERKTSDRKGMIYLDFLQNRPQATVAGVYSLRPKPGATVSMPLYWEEVRKGLKMGDFNIFNTIKRLEQTGDLFKGVLGKGIDLARVLKNLEQIRD